MQIEDGRFPKMSWSRWNKRLGHDVLMKQYLTFIISLKLLLSVHFCLQNHWINSFAAKIMPFPGAYQKEVGIAKACGSQWDVDEKQSLPWQHCRMKSDSFIMDSHEGWAWKPTIPAPNWSSLIRLVHVSYSCQVCGKQSLFPLTFLSCFFDFFSHLGLNPAVFSHTSDCLLDNKSKCPSRTVEYLWSRISHLRVVPQHQHPSRPCWQRCTWLLHDN